MSYTEHAVATLPPGVKLGARAGRVSLDSLGWPLGRPGRLAAPGSTLADLGPGDHVVGFTQNVSFSWPVMGTRAMVSVIMAEPQAIHGAKQHRVARIASRFHRVLSYNESLLARLPNGLFFPCGGAWVSDWRERDLSKHATCSLIASEKRSQEGHVLRHAMAQRVRREGCDVAVLGRGYAPFADKAEGLAPYRYSLVIENARERNYFTEKLLDAVLCRTVPIYWGCPNIGDFMDVSGMILCETEEDMARALSMMSREDYAARLPGLHAAAEVAELYSDIYLRAAHALLADAPVPPAGRPQ
ncbi:glycosyltransferase family 10 domain-containing protein [Roseovarius salis]|uniref:glycosyltransferase family 10 domain-containing protein n=1 Tax=Roseovarius salis TaxID=3376063 RepID=UPI0037C781B0